MTQLDIKALKNQAKGTPFQGTILVRSADVREAKNKSEYIIGSASTMSGDIGFKIWGGATADFVKNNLSMVDGAVCKVIGKVDEWQGTKSLIVEHLDVTGEDPSEYGRNVYNIDKMRESYLLLLKSNLSDEGLKILSDLLSPLSENFFKEFASITIHHDNVRGGLVAHSYKVTLLMEMVLSMYPDISNRLDRDLLIIGIALHDIGKAVEYSDGGISEIGKLVSHRTIANELLAHQKDMVVAVKGEEWYWRLHAIFAQHHGEYEETPRTFEALLVHVVDSMESQTTDISQALRDNEPGTQVRLHGFKLN